MSETSHDQPEHEHGDHEHHAVPMKTYWTVFGMLCLLTMASFFTYTEVWREHFNAHAGWALMMAVSCCKALLVILFFMHLKYEANWKYVLTIPAGFMSIFLLLMLVPDIGRRTYRYSAERWEHASDYQGAAFYISQMLPVPTDLSTDDHAGGHGEEHDGDARGGDDHEDKEGEHGSVPHDGTEAAPAVQPTEPTPVPATP